MNEYIYKNEWIKIFLRPLIKAIPLRYVGILYGITPIE